MSATAARNYPAPQKESKTRDNSAPGEKSLYYTNVGLFSDPYLEALPKTRGDSFILKNWDTFDSPEFNECYEWMLSTWDELKDILPKLSEDQLRAKWIDPILQRLGWEYQVEEKVQRWGKSQRPDYSLFESQSTWKKAQGCPNRDEGYFKHVTAIGEAKEMGVPLDATKLNNTNPSFQIISYLVATGKDWGILTDGRYWRLYTTKSKSSFRAYYEVNIEKFLGERDDDQFLYFYNFFRKVAFLKDATNNQSFLDVVFESGEHYAREVETKLKERAFELVELIAQGFSAESAPKTDEELRVVYEHSLYFLFRLLFILNCEAKGLLSVHRNADYYPYSLRSLCMRIKQERESNQNWARVAKSYNHINDLFQLLTTGDERIGLHGFGKEVFSSGDKSFYKNNPIPDSHLNKVLLALAFAEFGKKKELRFIDYKILSADHLGSVFEGLLEYKLTGSGNGKNKEVVLVNSSGERKSTGSYYTPEGIVDYIVKETLEPLTTKKSVEDILKLKVIDPAMGSGHFLLGAVRFLEQIILTRLNESGGGLEFEQGVNWAVLHSCVYGIDKNPMAVELAKFSLWIYTAKNGYELEPLSDQLVCCDSLLDQKKWEATFSPVVKSGGFSAVVGNPPYVRQEYLSASKEELESRFDCFHSSADLYAYFIEKGIKMLCDGGRFGMIVANKWMRTEWGKPLRLWLNAQGLEKLVDFGDLPVFPGIAAYPVIIFAAKRKPQLTMAVAPVMTLDSDDLKKHVDEVTFEVNRNDLDDSGWTFKSPDQQRLYAKLSADSVTLADYVKGNAFYGIKTGLTPAFVVDEAFKKKVDREDRASSELLKPFVLGRDVKRYSDLKAKKYLIFMPKGWTNKNKKGSGPAWDWFRKNYRMVAEHLSQFRDKAEKRSDKGDYWWEIRACDYYDKFESPKISYLRFQVKPAFTLDTTGQYANDAVWSFESTDKYLLALLNSKLGWFLISQHCTQIQGGFQLIWQNMSHIPIKRADKFKKADLQKIGTLVDRAIKERAKGTNPGIHGQTETEAEIDSCLYQLFGLTKSDISTVEKYWNQNSKSRAADAEDDDIAA